MAMLLIAGALAVAGCGQVAISTDEHLERAQLAHAEGDLRTAVIEIKNALQRDPAHAEARRLLGIYSLELGDAPAAENELSRALELGGDPDLIRLPLTRAWQQQAKVDKVLEETRLTESFLEFQVPEALTIRGLAFLMQVRAGPADEAFRAALEANPEHPEAMLGLAWVAILQDRQDQARLHLEEALSLDPGYTQAWVVLGDLEQSSGNLEAAELAYSRALESSESSFDARLKRATLRIAQNDFDSAAADIGLLEQNFAPHPGVHHAKGLAAFQDKRYADAQAEFERALAMDRDHMPSVFYLGASHYAQGRWNQAETHLLRFSARFPEVRDAQRLLAQAQLQRGDAQRAAGALEGILSSDPDDVQALRQVGAVYTSQGRNREAMEHMRRLVSLEPESPDSRARLGLALLREGHREEAFRELDALLTLDPLEADDLELRVIADRLAAGDTTGATAAAEHFRSRNPGDARVYSLIGMIHLQQGDASAAEAAFRDALGLNPGQADAVNNLAILLARENRIDEAMQVLREGLAAQPAHPGLSLALARFHSGRAEYPAAENLLERVIEAHPEALAPRLALASLHTHQERAREAHRVLREGERWHRGSQDWLRAMASAQMAVGENLGAAENLERLVALDPSGADAHFTLGRLQAGLGHPESAVASLEAGLEVDPGHRDARRALVQLLIEADRLTDAERVLQPLVTSDPIDLVGSIQASNIKSRQGAFQGAADVLASALEDHPEQGSLYLLLAEAQWAAGQRDAAVGTLETRVSGRPDDLQAQMKLGTWYLEAGRESEATDAFRSAVEIAPANPIALNNLAWLLRRDDPDTALGLAQRALAAAPDVPPFLHTLGSVQLEGGDYPAAVATLRRASELAPSSPDIRLSLARGLVLSGDPVAARAELRGLLESHPGFPGAAEAEQILRDLE